MKLNLLRRFSDHAPTFGLPLSGTTYHSRPSAYVVLVGTNGRIAVVQTPKGWFLPGGGIKPGERAEDAAVRECREECGLDVSIGHHIGDAIQFVDASGEGYFKIEGSFFVAKVLFDRVGPVELDHETIWISPLTAADRMLRPFEAWAIRRAGLAA